MISTNAVTWTLTAEPECEGPEGDFASGDDAQDAALCARIREEAEWNEWAWCIARVRGEWNGLTADVYLGGCSYASEADFRDNSGYFADMQEGVLADLNRQAEQIALAWAQQKKE